MAQKWTDHQLGKPGTGGIENFSARTGFVPTTLETTIPFGRGLVYQKNPAVEDGVVVYGDSTGGAQFAGFAKYSQEATVFSKEHAGPIARNAIYPVAYQKGDVVGLVDRGSVIVKIDAGESSGIKAGDRICVVKNGFVRAYKNISSPGAEGSNSGLLIDAIAESDGAANENISIQIYSLAASEFKFN